MRKIRVSYTGFEPLYVERPEVESLADAESLCLNPEVGVPVLVRKAADIELQQQLRTFLKEAEPKDFGFEGADLSDDDTFAAYREALREAIQEKADGWLFDETPKPRGGRRDKKVDVSKYGDEEELSTMSAADLIAKMREDGAIK